jgi:hypothetical protein
VRSRWTRHEYELEQWEKFWGDYPDSPPKYTAHYEQSYSSDLEQSDGHLISLLGKTHEDIGGNFLVTRRHYREGSTLGSYGSHLFTHPNGYAEGVWKTPQFARYSSFGNSAFPLVQPTDILERMALGREAISKTIPTASSFDGATFLGELREGLPHIIPFARTGRSRTRRARNAGDEYLNIEFGWKPLLRDYHSFSNAVRNAEAILDEYEKNSGKMLHRSYDWPVEQTVEIQSPTLALPTPLIDQTNLYEPGGYLGSLVVSRKETVHRWFSAAYMYWFPTRGSAMRRSSELTKLYGLEISPDMLWNLAPWSWAADWVGDAGTLMKNVSLLNRDNLVMPYAYLMETKTVEVNYQLSGIRYKAYPGEQIFRQSFITEVKSRIQASPYGFDVDWPDLSGRQLGILGALGISKA